MRAKLCLIALTLLLTLSLTGCNLGADDTPRQPVRATNTTPPQQAAGKPTIRIDSPENGRTVPVNQQVLVSATATDEVGVTRVQLFANGQIVKTVSSETAAGQRTFSAVLDYTPTTQGNVTLRVLAYRASVVSDPAEIQIVVGSPSAPTSTPSAGGGTSGGGSSGPVIDPNDPTCRALVNTGLNMRQGPNTTFSVIRTLPAGEQIPLTGRLGDNSWWQVRSGTSIGWISAQFTTLYGNCQSIPVVAAPASPTPLNQPTATWTPTITPIPSATMTNAPTPTPSDLVITSIVGETDVLIMSGQTSVTEQYTFIVTNTGARRTPSFTMRVQITGQNPIDIQISGLRQNESITIPLDLTFNAAGSYTIQARADINNQVEEVSEVNNSALYEVTVTQN
ncbi:MAG: Ig-like domain-containing protein [Anaerolineae bacterium]|jgi:hypothetical protein|nr:Ig-like domain-containing protein [Anaerolineae bacterium]